MPVLIAALAVNGFAHMKRGAAAPKSDPPFCYYLVPSDEIGFKDSPVGFQITHDGAINNGFGELDLAVGSDFKPVDVRVKTLREPGVPVVDYSEEHNGVDYSVEAFASCFSLNPMDDLIAFVKIEARNNGNSTQSGAVRFSYNPRGTDARADLPCHPWFADKFMDKASFGDFTAKNPGSFQTTGNSIYRNGHLVFQFEGKPTVGKEGNSASYSFTLAPGAVQSFYIRMPFVPIGKKNPDAMQKISEMGFGSARRQIESFWKGIEGRALNVQVDDPKVTSTLKASLMYDLMARDIEADGKHFTQTVNKFQYHYFYARDASFIARSYEMLNLPEVARGVVEHYLIRDANGKVVKFLHENPDDWGQSLWALGSYYSATGDKEFAKDVANGISAHLDDFVKSVASDPKGLWPVAGPYDNELIDGHYTSHDLWALLGLDEAKILAKGAGDDALAARAEALRSAFFTVFLNRLADLTRADGGYIPPGMDDPTKGYDWENASGGVYPFRVFIPNNPWAMATVALERKYKFREGIMTWGPNAYAGELAAEQGKPFDPLYLHDYDTFQVSEASLAQGDQKSVIEDLYSTLVHTSATDAGFETGIRPWGNRDPDDNYPPHGWFAARYNELIRNMLLREDGNVLHLASALAPQWIKPGHSVVVRHGANDFGTLDFTLRSRATGADVTISAKWRNAPAVLDFHLPWYVRATSATVDGHPTLIREGVIQLDPDAKRLSIQWQWIGSPNLSYDEALRQWKQRNEHPLPGEDMDHLFPN